MRYEVFSTLPLVAARLDVSPAHGAACSGRGRPEPRSELGSLRSLKNTRDAKASRD